MRPHDRSMPDLGTIVLLHSLGTDRHLWRYQEQALTGTYPIHIPEAPGHGTRPWTGQTTLEAFVADLHEQLADLAGPLHLVGTSMGGHLAVGYAAAHPDRVASLLIANSFARQPANLSADRIARIAADIDEAGMDRYATRYLEQTLTRNLEAEDQSALHDAIAGMMPEAYLAAAAMTFGGDITALCGQLLCPTLVVSGANDNRVPNEWTSELVAALASSGLTVLDDAGHLSCIEQPAAFTSTLTAFVDQVTASDAEGARA